MRDASPTMLVHGSGEESFEDVKAMFHTLHFDRDLNVTIFTNSYDASSCMSACTK